MGKVIHVNTVIAHHLVFMGYGHWLANDPRGSGSSEVRAETLKDLGEIHHGRKRIQPSREALREFYRDAEQKLDHEIIWFDGRMRRVIEESFGSVIAKRGYTAYAGAVLQKHAHGVMRVHRDKGEFIWENLAVASYEALRTAGLVPKDHPVWSCRPYVVYKKTVPLVHKAIGYVEDNFAKHGLKKEIYPWITSYDGWPHRRETR